MSAEHQLITPRRNFLIRALGFTAAGATIAVPNTTLADAEARIAHHSRELEKAMRDRYGPDEIWSDLTLPEPGAIGVDHTKDNRRYHKRPIIVIAGRGGWINPPR
jgi:hypothetical protein